MSAQPLVSIAMPCYNAAKTLPMALASLLVQSYENWECLLVDDGSTDNPGDVVDRAGDPRIRLIQLGRNRGRGVARQVALDHAEGDLLGMLDADDWFYPSKLTDQVGFLLDEPGAVLVSAGMAIVGENDELMGVRCCGPAGPRPKVHESLHRLAAPPVAHAPSLIRTTAARNAGYDPALGLSEDVDFLLRVLQDRRFAILPTPAYAYSEHGSATAAKATGGMRSLRRVFRKHRSRFPVSSRVRIAETHAKELVYRLGFAVGMGDRLIGRRSRTPTPSEAAAYEAARVRVAAIAAELSESQNPLERVAPASRYAPPIARNLA